MYYNIIDYYMIIPNIKGWLFGVMIFKGLRIGNLFCNSGWTCTFACEQSNVGVHICEGVDQTCSHEQ